MYEIICFDKYGNSIDEFVQWDINRQLYINWEHDCTPIFQFGNTKSDRLLVVRGRLIEEDGLTIAEVNVPNILLQQPYPVLCFVYLENEVDGDEGYFVGKTVFNFNIPVKKKKKPEDYKYQENTEYISWVNLEAEAKTFIAELELETHRIITELEDALGTAKDNADIAVNSASEAKLSETNAKSSELNANDSEANAKTSEVNAKESETKALQSENKSNDYATLAKSWAVGNTKVRDGEDFDNSKYYCQRTQAVYESLGGVFRAMGSIPFSELHNVDKQIGYVYHITDAFVTDEYFKCGAGVSYPSGTNIYYTADGYWDCFAGRFITNESFDSIMNTINLLEERIKAMEDVTVLEINV